jgi:hypothetical protein
MRLARWGGSNGALTEQKKRQRGPPGRSLSKGESMTDAIRAALISGSVQIVTSLLTMTVALLALNSWRRNALGARQIELAEQCLQAVWELDEEIAATRRLLFPGDFERIKAEPEFLKRHTESYQRAYVAMRECLLKATALKKQLMLAEIYLGELPRTKFRGTTRFFNKMPYTIQDEYEEVLSQLLLALNRTSPAVIEQGGQSTTVKEEFDKSANLFYGFMHEYEEDEFSIRLRLTRTTFERHIRTVLRRRTISDRILDRITDSITDRLRRKFKPATVNKLPYSKYLADQSPKKTDESIPTSSAASSEDREPAP